MLQTDITADRAAVINAGICRIPRPGKGRFLGSRPMVQTPTFQEGVA